MISLHDDMHDEYSENQESIDIIYGEIDNISIGRIKTPFEDTGGSVEFICET